MALETLKGLKKINGETISARLFQAYEECGVYL